MSRHDVPNVFWFIPTHGDGRYLGSPIGGRDTSYHYMRQIAQAADDLGYGGVLMPTGASCEDAWLVAASMAASTEWLRFLVAVRPGLMSPTLSARMAATLDRLWEIVAMPDIRAQAARVAEQIAAAVDEAAVLAVGCR